MTAKRAIGYLSKGRSPYGTRGLLATAPRRMTMRDVGCVGLGCSADSDSAITGDELDLPTPLRPPVDPSHQHLSYEYADENPFGFSLGLDAE